MSAEAKKSPLAMRKRMGAIRRLATTGFYQLRGHTRLCPSRFTA